MEDAKVVVELRKEHGFYFIGSRLLVNGKNLPTRFLHIDLDQEGVEVLNISIPLRYVELKIIEAE